MWKLYRKQVKKNHCHGKTIKGDKNTRTGHKCAILNQTEQNEKFSDFSADSFEEQFRLA